MTELVPAPGWTVLTVPPGAGYRPLDEDEIRRACGVLLDPAHAVSLMRLPGGSRRVVPALADRVIEAARAMSEGAIGVYASVCPVSPTLDHAMKVGDALSRPWLDIDIDPERPDDVMASEGEHALALGMGRDIHEGLCEMGWPAPVLIDSGSGCRLLYRINLPNDRDTRDLILRCLERIFSYWKRDGIVEDHGSASAITHCKIPGTWARKGPDTPDRPHRMVRLIHAPACVEVVSRELLEELAGPAAERPATPPAWSLRVPGVGTEKYGQAALDREVQRVLMARAGDKLEGRNTTLNDAAWNIFRLVAGGVIEDAVAYSDLLSAGLRAGLPERECRDVLDRARRDAASSPRGVPDRPAVAAPSANGKHETVLVCGKNIAPRRVEWLWPHRIPLGKLTTFAGVTSLGKTFALCDITARVSRGDNWPDGAPNTHGPANAIFISAEDDAEDTLVPRLAELDADLDRVWFLSMKAAGIFTLRHLGILDKAMEEAGEVRFLAIDPPTAYLAGTDDHKNAELRQILSPLQAWAARNRVAVVFNTHLNKAGGQKVEAIMRVMGSVAWVNAVRAAHVFAADPEDKELRYFVPMKSNLGPRKNGLAYRIEAIDQDRAKLVWHGEVDVTADQAVGKDKPPTRKQEASAWLIERFKEKKEWPSDELFNRAKEDNVSRNAVFEAKAALKLPKARQVVQKNGDRVFYWWVPDDWTPPATGKADTAEF